jgi:hypothetical protein
MATLLTMHPVEGRLGADERHRPILYTPTKLHCAWASHDLQEALYALHAPLETIEARIEEVVMEYETVFGERFNPDEPPHDHDPEVGEFIPVPFKGFGWSLLLVTAAQLVKVPWDALSEDARGKILKGAAWTYLAALPPDTQVVVHLSH